eukprot:7314218-Ditylum_brightwellii.AAC.1
MVTILDIKMTVVENQVVALNPKLSFLHWVIDLDNRASIYTRKHMITRPDAIYITECHHFFSFAATLLDKKSFV